AGKRHAWMFDLDYLTNFMNYEPVSLENQANKSAGPKETNYSAGTKIQKTTDCKKSEMPLSQVEQIFQKELEKLKRQEKEANDAVRKEATYETKDVNTNSTNLLNTVSASDNYASLSAGIFTNSSYDDDDDVVTDFNILKTIVNVSPTPTTRIHTIHPKLKFLEILCQLFRQEVKCTRTLKLMLLNKKNERGVVVRNKARLVAQGHRQDERIDYDKVFALVARIEAIRIFLAFASYMGFIVYQMDVKSAFLYRTIDEEVYVIQPPRFVDPKFPNKVYKVVKALYGLHQALSAWYATLSTFLEKSGYRRGAIDKTLFIKQDKKDIMLVKQKEDGIFISQDMYVAEILKKFDFLSVKTASTPIETQTPLVKDKEDVDVDVTPKTSHLQAVKRIFRYLKGQPKLGLWYPKASSFDLQAYLDSDYAGANIDRKSTTEDRRSYLRNNKWYQSLVRSFDQQKNHIQAHQKKKMMKKRSSSENKPCCSKACKKNTDNLNSKIIELSEKLDDKDLSWTGLPEFADDTVTDYSRPSTTIESFPDDAQNKNPSIETGASDSTILSKCAIKFVKATDKATERPTTDKVKTAKKPAVKSMPPRPAIHRPYRPLMRTTRPNLNAATRPYVNSARLQTTQELMIILIQRVQRLKRELKARTPVHKGNSGEKLEDAVRRKRSRGVGNYILQIKKKVLTKKLDCRCSIKFRGGLLGIKCLRDYLVQQLPCLTRQKIQSKEQQLLLPSKEQMAAGKETSNPLMADSLPITILLTMLAIKLLLFMGYA
nr:hypothetical protein [Tanacetum cinerariifolium]